MELHIYCGRCPRGAGHPWTGIPVADYIAWVRDHEGEDAADRESQAYQRALRAAMTHPWWDSSRAAPPGVHYNPDRGEVYYSFETAQEGRTIFVSRHPLRSLQRWAMRPRRYHDYRVVEV